MKQNRAKTTPLTEIVHDTAVNSAQSKVKVDLIIDHFISVVATALKKGSRPDVHNFGYFRLNDTQRPGVKTVIFVPRNRLIDYVSEPFKAMAEAGLDTTLPVKPKRKPPRRKRRIVIGKPVRIFREDRSIRIPWEVHVEAYAGYSQRFGTGRTAEDIARYGGFSRAELNVYLPGWESQIIPV